MTFHSHILMLGIGVDTRKRRGGQEEWYRERARERARGKRRKGWREMKRQGGREKEGG